MYVIKYVRGLIRQWTRDNLAKPHSRQCLDGTQTVRGQVIIGNVAIEVSGINAHTFNVHWIFSTLPGFPSTLSSDVAQDVGRGISIFGFEGWTIDTCRGGVRCSTDVGTRYPTTSTATTAMIKTFRKDDLRWICISRYRWHTKRLFAGYCHFTRTGIFSTCCGT